MFVNVGLMDRTYTADIQTEHVEMDYNHDPEELTHTYSPEFNPYKQSRYCNTHLTQATLWMTTDDDTSKKILYVILQDDWSLQ